MAANEKDSATEKAVKSGEDGSQQIFRPRAVPAPTIGRVESMAKDLNMDLTQEELKDFRDYIDGALGAYDAVYRMVEPKPPVKYPRTPGYRPPPEENIYNAWYVKTDIKGAPTGKLAGKRVAIKDNIAIAGVPMMNGTKLLEGYMPDYDATVVIRILDAGGHILGKSVCEHFCLSGNSFTTDLNPVLNPHDKTRSTGGSSSGNGALLAAGEVDMSIGGDQGGSVRMPPCWCGVVGLKPTFGLVPYTGAIPIEPTIDHLGPMTRTVRDCALLLEVVAGGDGLDYRQPDYFPPIPEYSKQLNSDLSGKKIGIVKEGFVNCEQDVVEAVQLAAKNLAKKGALVEEMSIPLHSDALAIWTPTCFEGGYNTLAVAGGYGPSAKGFHDNYMMRHMTKSFQLSANDLSHQMKVTCLLGKYLQESNNFEYYGRSSNLIAGVLTPAYDKALKEYDVLVMPTLPYKAPKLPAKDTSPMKLIQESFAMIQNTAPFNATGHPAITVPVGKSEGLPVGMSIIGRKWHDQDVLNVALAQEELGGNVLL